MERECQGVKTEGWKSLLIIKGEHGGGRPFFLSLSASSIHIPYSTRHIQPWALRMHDDVGRRHPTLGSNGSRHAKSAEQVRTARAIPWRSKQYC